MVFTGDSVLVRKAKVDYLRARKHIRGVTLARLIPQVIPVPTEIKKGTKLTVLDFVKLASYGSLELPTARLNNRTNVSCSFEL
jgi:hypothetical protein